MFVIFYALTTRLDNVDNTSVDDGGAIYVHADSKLRINASSFTSKNNNFQRITGVVLCDIKLLF